MSSFDPIARSHAYFNAWRQRDAAAVLATLAPGGTYEDPLTGGPISGDAFAGYMQGLWAAFPDLDFALGEVVRVGDDHVHGQWRMHGHNHGSFNGLPPSGRAVDLPGIDVIVAGTEGLKSVRGYFDSAVVPRQLGLDVIVQPREIGPFGFGIATVVRRPQPVTPGVLAFTELFAAGRRMTTVSAWASHEALRAAMRSGTHAQAMQRFWHEGIAEGGHTAVYTPLRQGPAWRRCGACGAMSRLDAAQGACSACGAPLDAIA